MKNACNYFLLITLFFVTIIQPASGKDEILLAGSNWEPYMGKKLLNKGFFVEITKQALENAGYKVKIVIVPWKRALKQALLGEYDVLIGASFTEERAKSLAYPVFAWEVKMSLFSLKENKINNFRKLVDICPAKIALIRGSYLHDRIKAIGCIEIDFGNTVEDNIMKLVHGQVNFYLESKDSVYHHINNEYPDIKNQISIISPPFETDKIYSVFSRKLKNYKHIVRKFDASIETLKKNGTFAKILGKHGIEYSEKSKQ